MILSWVLFPLVLAAVGLGWGSLVEWAAGGRGVGALTIPLGLAAAIVVAALFTAFSASAPAAAPVVGGGRRRGLAARMAARAARPRRRSPPASACSLVYGAPVILSGQATFLGYVRLDDTATWLAFIDQFFAHGRSLASLPSSTYSLLLADQPHAARLPVGRVHARRRRPLDHRDRRRRGSSSPTWRPARARSRSAAGSCSSRSSPSALAARVRRVHRRAVGAAVRLRRLGRDQGAHGGVPARARARGDGAAAARRAARRAGATACRWRSPARR